MGKAEMSKEEAKLAVEKYKKLLERKKRKKDKEPHRKNGGEETNEKVLKMDEELSLSPHNSHPPSLNSLRDDKNMEEANRPSQASIVSSEMDYSQRNVLSIYQDRERNIIASLPSQREEVILLNVEGDFVNLLSCDAGPRLMVVSYFVAVDRSSTVHAFSVSKEKDASACQHLWASAVPDHIEEMRLLQRPPHTSPSFVAVPANFPCEFVSVWTKQLVYVWTTIPRPKECQGASGPAPWKLRRDVFVELCDRIGLRNCVSQ